MNDFYIWINQNPIHVNEDVYKAYWKGNRKERYFAESDIHNHVLYYDALDTDETNGSDIFQDEACIPVDEQVIQNMEISKLKDALSTLSPFDHELIFRLYLRKRYLAQQEMKWLMLWKSRGLVQENIFIH